MISSRASAAAVKAAKAVVLLVLLVAVASFVAQAFPGLVGAEYALTVQSGSMEPAVMTGSVVFVADVPPEHVGTGDIITYSDSGRNLVTHRVVEKYTSATSLRFITQGDANENPDSKPVYRSDYVGRVMEVPVPIFGSITSVPYAGYIIAFSQTPMGYATMVLVPVILLIFSELWSLYRALEPVDDTTDKP